METRVMKPIIASTMHNQNEYDISGEAVCGQVRPRAVAIVFEVKRFITRTVLLVLVSLCASNPLYALTGYITDEFEITMRSGTSTANSIVRMLRSGEAVTVLEEDLVTQYSLVETSDGKQGYVLSRFLMDIPAAKQTLPQLEVKFAQQRLRLEEQATEVSELKQMLDLEKSDNDALKSTLQTSAEELSQIRTAAEDTLNILEQNKQLQTVVEQLQQEKAQLSATNAELSDSTRIDWFVRGGVVSLIAFVIGIVVTRIRWKKKDSWGSY
jgi:SH3 domain protein